jgi:hypothetical protein
MDDLVQQLQEKAGLTEEQAYKALETMKGYLMGKVPPMFSGFVENFFAKASNNTIHEEDPLG